ncbi:ROK family transcriptional regulator [Actinoplanes sp. NPDC051470]|uniref:ROK family transcriptional regulator n=1 Tax=unclassified Actinoplanes TaxID=2626549 RepID=UPI0034161922
MTGGEGGTVTDPERALPQAVLRAATDRRLLDETIRRGQTTRAELAALTGYSRPTVSEAVRRMVAQGLLDASGLQETGKRGRVGTFYSLGARAGWVLGLEISQTGVRARATDLSGAVLHEDANPPTSPGNVAELTASVRSLVIRLATTSGTTLSTPPPPPSPAPSPTSPAPSPTSPAPSATSPAPSPTSPAPSATSPAPSPISPAPSPISPALSAASPPSSLSARAADPGRAGFAVGRGPFRAIGVSIASPVDPATQSVVALHGTPFPDGLLSPERMLADLTNAPILADNDVNLAALAEHRLGRAAGESSFAYVYLGAGMGVGLYIGHQLIRGAHGLAGEIGYLPGIVSPTLSGDLRAGGFDRNDAPYVDVNAVLALLDQPSETAIRQLAEALSRAIVSVAAVVDPALFLLGGPVGTHPSLLPKVRELITFPGPTRLEHGALGADAPLTGALQLALEYARAAATAP